MRELTLRVRPASLAFAAVTAAALFAGLTYVRASGAPTATPLAIEGTLTDAAGRPASGLWNFSVAIFDVASGGTARATCPLMGRPVMDGRFTLPLAASGDTAPCVTVFRDVSNTWVELEATNGTQTVRTARAQVHAVPYSLEADRAVTATSATSATGALEVRLAALEARASRLEANRVARVLISDLSSGFAWSGVSNVSSVERLGNGHYRVNFACQYNEYAVQISGTCEECTYSWTVIDARSIQVRVNEPAIVDGGLTSRRVSYNPGLVSVLVVGAPIPGSMCIPP